MGAIAAVLRAGVRSHLRAWIALAIVIGLSAGAAATTIAGARRTETAYRRFLVAQRASDAVLAPVTEDPVLPQVVASARVALYDDVAVDVPRRGIVMAGGQSRDLALLSDGGGFGRSVDVFKIQRGRIADPRRADEATADLNAARRLGIKAGDVLGVSFPPTDSAALPLDVRVRIVGIGVQPGGFEPVAGVVTPRIVLSNALHLRLRERAGEGWFPEALVVRLRHGQADLASLRTTLEELPRKPDTYPIGIVEGFGVERAQSTARIEHETRTQAVALLILGAMIALAGAAVSSQAVARQLHVEAVEYPQLRALGMSTRQLARIGTTRALAVYAAGAATGAIGAIAASPLMPIGLARIAEPHPGVAIDVVVWAVAALTVLVGTAFALVPSVRIARAAARSENEGSATPSKLAAALGRGPLPVTSILGVRMTFERGRGRTAVPVRATAITATLGVMAIALAITTGANFARAVGDPTMTGRTWDARFELIQPEEPNGPTKSAPPPQRQIEPVVEALTNDHSVAGLALGGASEVAIEPTGNKRVGMVVIESVRGSLGPAVAEGRLPRTDREILVSEPVLARTHSRIGGTLTVWFPQDGGPWSRTMSVVGRGVFPIITTFSGEVDEAVAMTRSGADALWAPTQEKRFDPNLVFVRFARGVDRARASARLERELGLRLAPDPSPTDLLHLGPIRRVPLAFAGIVTVIAFSVLAQMIVSSVRRRRAELAILKTLGMTRGSVSAIVAWQATSLAALAVALGIPAGIAAGGWLWKPLARMLDVVPSSSMRLDAIFGVLVPGAFILANLAAASPARRAGRIAPAIALRALD